MMRIRVANPSGLLLSRDRVVCTGRVTVALRIRGAILEYEMGVAFNRNWADAYSVAAAPQCDLAHTYSTTYRNNIGNAPDGRAGQSWSHLPIHAEEPS